MFNVKIFFRSQLKCVRVVKKGQRDIRESRIHVENKRMSWIWAMMTVSCCYLAKMSTLWDWDWMGNTGTAEDNWCASVLQAEGISLDETRKTKKCILEEDRIHSSIWKWTLMASRRGTKRKYMLMTNVVVGIWGGALGKYKSNFVC